MTFSKTLETQAFVRANTVKGSPPLVPEIVLHLASDVVPLWTRTEEIRAGTVPPPYWAFAWPGGQAVARYILDHPDLVSGRSVLDLGAGSGLVAIAAAKAGARASATDIDPWSIAAIGLNAAANDCAVEIIDQNVIGGPRRWQTVCAGDMCYERPLAERLLGWLRRLADEGSEVLVGDPGRAYLPAAGLERLATFEVPTSRDLEDRDVRETSVYRLLPA